VSYFLIVFSAILVITGIYYYVLKNSIIERTLAQLSSINVLKKAQIEDYFELSRSHLSVIANGPEIQQAFAFFSGKQPFAQEGRTGDFEKDLNDFLIDYHYSEIALLDSSLNIIFPLDLADKPLGKILMSDGRIIADFIKESSTKFSRLDITNAFDLPQKTSILIGVPIKGVNKNEFLGIMILKKEFEKVDKILHERTGMGNTGESYIVAEDLTMRSSSRFFPDSVPASIVVNTLSASYAFSGSKKNHVLDDYRGVPVLSAYSKLDLDGLNWAILSEIDLQEALRPLDEIRQYVIYTFFVLMIIILWITLFISGKISKPILKLKDEIEKLSKGKLPREKIANTHNDEIGQITDALNQLMTGLKSTADFAYKIGKNNLDASFDPLSEDDVLGLSLLEMRENLRILKDREKKLNRQRAAALIEGQEKERRRFAMEIHDGLGQILVAIKFKLSGVKDNPEEVALLRKYLDDSIEEVRRISNNVMPAVLIDFGLQAGMQQLCKNIEKYAGIKVDFVYDGGDTVENPVFDISVGLYRIAQEALNNAVKHASATHVEVCLSFGPESVVLTLKDNGKGFDIARFMSNSAHSSNGIKNMKERARLLNGKFDIKSVLNEGTFIKVDVPLYPIEKEYDSLMED
jgi:two-component system, NarL family, sensor kinase